MECKCVRVHYMNVHIHTMQRFTSIHRWAFSHSNIVYKQLLQQHTNQTTEEWDERK